MSKFFVIQSHMVAAFLPDIAGAMHFETPKEALEYAQPEDAIYTVTEENGVYIVTFGGESENYLVLSDRFNRKYLVSQ